MIRSRRSILLPVLGGAFLLVFFLPGAAGLATDWLWFREIGLERIMLTEIRTKMALFGGAAVLAWAFLYLNLRYARRGVVPVPLLLRSGDGTPPLNLTDVVGRAAVPISLLAAVVLALGVMADWLPVLAYLQRVPFGVSDPVFERDVGFYVFVLPVVAGLLGWALAVTILTLLLTAAVYWVRRDIIVLPRKLRVEPSAELHLGLLLALVFVLLAVRIWAVRVPGLLFGSSGPLVGAGYTDLHARLPALHISAAVALLGAGWIVLGARRRQLVKHTAIAAAAFVAVGVLAGGVYPAVVQKFVVAPTELTRERPQLVHHIAATRRAWGLEDVEIRDLTGEDHLALADIRRNAATIENVRLWDRAPLLQTFGQLQEIRTYYDFVSVDDDRYTIDGRYRQVLLSPREMNPAVLPTRSFINEHLTFTHGMGVTLGPVNQSTSEGLPVLFIKDLPPQSSVSLQVRRPQIYYGELTDSYAIVRTRQPEFDYPAGDENIFAPYAGRGGVPVGGMLRRALFAVHFGASEILLSEDIHSRSRILYRRNVVERARAAFPFLRFDGDPYLVITDSGELRWILDAYTSSSHYPYAQRLEDGTTYLRNSVKVVIDAYHGSIEAFVAAPADPIVRTYARIFPGVFRPLAEMPADLRSHLRYPEDLYRVQAALYATYHMDEPDEFYHREDQWQIPATGAGDEQNPFMRRIVMRLPEEQEAEYIFMTPFTPRQKDNLAAWMVARSDGEHYGKLRVYRFPKQSLVFGPRQITNRINQDTEISRQISLWDQRGSEVIRGELLVIPIEESLIYVQPLYLRAQGGAIPELKRVIVVYQNRVVMEERLDQALARLFGGRTETAGRPVAPAAEGQPGAASAVVQDAVGSDLVRRAQEHFERAIQAQRAGNWAEYGVEIQRLGEVLRQMESEPGAER